MILPGRVCLLLLVSSSCCCSKVKVCRMCGCSCAVSFSACCPPFFTTFPHVKSSPCVIGLYSVTVGLLLSICCLLLLFYNLFGVARYRRGLRDCTSFHDIQTHQLRSRVTPLCFQSLARFVVFIVLLILSIMRRSALLSWFLSFFLLLCFHIGLSRIWKHANSTSKLKNSS